LESNNEKIIKNKLLKSKTPRLDNMPVHRIERKNPLTRKDFELKFGFE
jgi:hypothetical protein